MDYKIDYKTVKALIKDLTFEEVKQALDYQCKKHPKYQAKNPPRCLCGVCWLIWERDQHEGSCHG